MLYAKFKGRIVGFDICVYVNVIQLHEENKNAYLLAERNQESLEQCCSTVRIEPLLTHHQLLNKSVVVFRIPRTLVSESLVVCETMGNGSQPVWIATVPILQGSLLRDVLHHHLSIFFSVSYASDL